MIRYLVIYLPIVLAMGVLFMPGSLSTNIYGQNIINPAQNNQTIPSNQIAQPNQTSQATASTATTTTAQQPPQTNQTQQQNNPSKINDPKMIENLLNYTNTAIIALNNNNEAVAQQNLVQIQNALVNASGKQVIVIPAPAIQSGDEEDSD